MDAQTARMMAESIAYGFQRLSEAVERNNTIMESIQKELIKHRPENEYGYCECEHSQWHVKKYPDIGHEEIKCMNCGRVELRDMK